jgi:AcrR family transcriptional regulator
LPRPARHEGKRQEILIAARRCFLRRGLRATTIADICKEAQMSPGHLYYYFASKDEILDAMFGQNLAAGAKDFGDLIAQSNAVAAITTVIEEAKNRNLRSEFLLFLEFVAEAGRNPAMGKRLRSGSHKVWAILAGILEQAQAKGFIDPALKPDATAAILFAMLDGIRVMTVRDPKIEMPVILDHLKIMVSRFLLPART